MLDYNILSEHIASNYYIIYNIINNNHFITHIEMSFFFPLFLEYVMKFQQKKKEEKKTNCMSKKQSKQKGHMWEMKMELMLFFV